MPKFVVTAVYEVTAEDEEQAVYAAWDVINYGIEETAHNIPSKKVKGVEVKAVEPVKPKSK
jgi:hypothetical protein